MIAKFKEGAWIIVVVGPFMYVALLRLNKQYVREERAFEAVSGRAATMNIRMNRVVVFVDTYDLVTERSLLYCLSLNAYSIRAVHFDIDPIVTAQLEEKWGSAGTASAGITPVSYTHLDVYKRQDVAPARQDHHAEDLGVAHDVGHELQGGAVDATVVALDDLERDAGRRRTRGPPLLFQLRGDRCV